MSPLRGRGGWKEGRASAAVTQWISFQSHQREDERKVSTRDYPFIDPASMPRMKNRPSRT